MARSVLGFKLTPEHAYLGPMANEAVLAQGHNPLTEKGKKILRAMRKQYGKRAKEVFYGARNAGKITGVD